MKKKNLLKSIFLIATLGLLVIGCKEAAPKDYVTIKGKIKNKKSEKLTIQGNNNFSKEILVNDDGSYSDTLKVTDGFHGITDGTQQSVLHLRNGYDFTLNFDANDLKNTVELEGRGAGTNQYMFDKMAYIDELDLMNNIDEIFTLEKPEFDAKMQEILKRNEQLLEEAEDLDPEVKKQEQDANLKMITFFNNNYEVEHSRLMAFKPGTISPKFSFPDVNGKVVSLDDLKGKYVYVDVWATWCAPCKREIPFLKELNAQYKGKDLEIVSLSIDKIDDKEKWLAMVKEENLQGIQLLANQEWNSDFVKDYNIQGIPRFILIDKEGKIVDADAPRPSDPRLIELFNKLEI
ncbi:TlpA family protein disulfide reductase [Namhaeicola litoreus]|uniref:TlpA family protein disulfide reductase n=1 Tax=Namhaeicola litoreus TaxID=1052145 RepID=A0ABW3Y4T7_9FLAO